MRKLSRWTAVAVAGVILGGLTTDLARAESREGRFWVFFAARQAPVPGKAPDLSDRAIERLRRVGRQPGSDPRDHAVSPELLTPITERGLVILVVSRFLNAASIMATEEQLNDLARDPRIREIRPVARFVRPIGPAEVRDAAGPPSKMHGAADAPRAIDPRTLSGADYGAAWTQSEMLGIPDLHALGYGGEGVLVAVFDSGFYKEHSSLRDLDLVAERDYVRGDGDTQYDPGDPGDNRRSNDHGTYTWSTLGGFAPGHLVGGAYRAGFVLAKTEDVGVEVHAEEDNYIAALEWADSLGADVVSTSLGYRDFDNGNFYRARDFDGETIPITRATTIAAERGIVVVTANGNEGPAASSLVAPADGKRLIAVGAVDAGGQIAQFSSRGPTADGRIKPDVCALGVSTYCASAFSPNSYARVNGTSLSTPLMGALAALIVEARPDWPPDSVAAALRRSGDRAAEPDNEYGWGIPDGPQALRLEIPRLRARATVWNDAEDGNGDGSINGGEAGDLSVWIRNDGLAASQPGALVPGSHDPGLALADSSGAALPAIAPGDSVLARVARLEVVPEATQEILPLFVTLRSGDIDVDRRIFLVVLPGQSVVSSFSGSPEGIGGIELKWRLQANGVTGLRLLRQNDGGQWVAAHEGVLAPETVSYVDRPGVAGLYRYSLEVQFLSGLYSLDEGPYEVELPLPGRPALGQPYSNPLATGSLVLPYAWGRSAGPIFEIFDVMGRRVASIHRDPPAGGFGFFEWDLKGAGGDPIPSGLYFIRLAGAGVRRLNVVR